MELEYKISKTQHMIFLKLNDCRERKILDYIKVQLRVQNTLHSMNARPPFLEGFEEAFEDERIILTIKYLNEAEGLFEILNVFFGYFEAYISETESSDTIEGRADFIVSNEEQLKAIIQASAPHVTNVGSSSSSEATQEKKTTSSAHP